VILFGITEWHTFFFALFAFAACAFAVAVVLSNNIVRMAFYLTMSLGSTAGLFFLAGAEFVGAMQFMIYVGGTLVLLIFGVMLTAHSRFISMKTPSGEWVFGVGLGGLLLSLLIYAALSIPDWSTNSAPVEVSMADSVLTTEIGLAFSGVRMDGQPGYLLPFLIVSVHLLVVLIGASYLARAKRRTASNPRQAP
jgi:NADH-quinone oxidoreductase subunit J